MLSQSELNSLKVGDKLFRVMAEFASDEYWTSDATVVEINDDTICCVVQVDCLRYMEFDKLTGVSNLGIDYGWLDKK